MNKARFQRYYAWCVLTAGILVLLELSRGLVQADMGDQPYTTLLLWLVLIGVSSLSPIPLPRGGTTVRLTTALDFAAILVFGPLFACWVGVIARLFTNATEKWTPFSGSLMRLGRSILTIAAAGWVFQRMGGQSGGDLMLLVDQITPLAAAGFTYVMTGLVLTLGWDRLSPAGTGGQWWRTTTLSAAADTVVLPFGILLALTQVRIGAVGVALFLVPLLLARYVFRLWIDAKRAHVDTVRTLMSAVDAADPFTWGLSYRISKMCLRVGRQLGLPGSELEELEYAALLHDIGRTAIKRDILSKPGKLSEAEQTVLRTHPRVGYELLSNLRFFPGAAEIVYTHHERPDGKGYPRGLKEHQIPLGSRIIMAVAAFDALTSDRPYRRGLSPDAALEELLNHTGTQFFPDVVEALNHLYAHNQLFDEFDEEVLARYGNGEGNSRALAEYFHRKALAADVPEKRGAAAQATIEMPPSEEDAMPKVPPIPVTMEREISLDWMGGGRLVLAGRSDPGCERSNNEDSFGIFDSADVSRGCLVVVADGMGGAAAGEVASRLALDTVREVYFGDLNGRGTRDALVASLETANEVVHAKARGDAALSGMGTTCTAVAIVGNELHIGHVGDSRAYLVRGSSIERLSDDHTLAAELAEMGRGLLNGQGNANHVLTRNIGTYPSVEVDSNERALALRPADAVVLCSDGLSNLVEDEEILTAVRQGTPAEACSALVDMARERGGPDNITVVVGRLEVA